MHNLKKPLSILLSFIMIISLFSIVPVTAHAAVVGVEYLYREVIEGTNRVSEEDRICTDYTDLSTFEQRVDHTLTSGWYVAGNVTFDQLIIDGNVKIIIPNGVTMRCEEGILVNFSQNSLTVYGQQGDTGVLDVFNSKDDYAGIGSSFIYTPGDLTFCGGTVIAESDDDAAAIGGGYKSSAGNIRILGGNVVAKGSPYGPGIGCGADGGSGKVYIYDGNVTATGGNRAAGIGGGNNAGGCEVFVYGGTVNATGGVWGAGIGGGNKGLGGKLFVYSPAKVTAWGGKGAAGVGGGDGAYKHGNNALYLDGTELYMYGGELEAHGGDEAAGIGGGNQEVSPGSNIFIRGGKVTAYGGEDYGAGIGGGDQQDGTTIRIFGGEVYAQGGNDAAGIGGGDTGGGGTITISGGTVTALGGRNAAGIGGGNKGDSGSITINGTAEVTATGGVNGAGVGNGNAGAGGNVQIENGTVTVSGGDYAAGIGGGNSADFGTVTISDGTVKATGGFRGAGIGGGDQAIAGTVTISGGESVKAYGGTGGAGIGKGSNTSCDSIIVNLTGGKVEATGGNGLFDQPNMISVKCAPAIGGSYFCGTINLNAGNITAHGALDKEIDSNSNTRDIYGYGTAIGSNSDNERVGSINIYPGVLVDTYTENDGNVYSYHYYAQNFSFIDNENGCSSVQYDSAYALEADRAKALGWKADIIHIQPCDHGEYTYEYVNSEYHKKSCRYCSFSFSENKQHNDVLTAWVWSNNNTAATAVFTCADCGHENSVKATVSTEPANGGYRFMASAVYKEEGYSTVRATDSDGNIIEDGVIVTWENLDGTILDSQVVPLGETPVYTKSTPVKPGVDSNRYTFVGWSDGNANYFTGEDLPEAITQTVYTPIYKFRNQTEPYIDASGEYIPGKITHYLIFNEYFEINGDNSVGVRLDSVDVSEFEFQRLDDNTYRINKYTGPTDNLTELVIPKKYKGNPVTIVGNDPEIGQNTNEGKLFNPAGSAPQITLVLNENIQRIGNFAFQGLNVKKVTGDTSALNSIGKYAFEDANPTGNYTLDFKFDYPGTIVCSLAPFHNLNLTARVKHKTKFDSLGASSISYVFTDEHVVTPEWDWAGDYSSATATFDCTDERCTFNETHVATVTRKAAGDKLTYTATVEAMGRTFTDVKVDDNYLITTFDPEHGKVETNVQRACEGDPVNVTITPDKGYHLSSVSVAKDNRVPLTAVRGGLGAEGESFDKLVDSNKYTNWRMDNTGHWTIIMKAAERVSMAGYSLTTGNTVSDDPGSNWKKWTISGGNFASDYGMEGAIDPGWHPIVEVDDGAVLQPVNNKTYDFTLNSPAEAYQYYLIRVYENSGSDYIQMSEFELKKTEVNVLLSGEGDTRSFSMPSFSVLVSAEFEPNPGLTVTYKVVNGTWSDGTSTDITETVASGTEPAEVPTGMKPADGYAGGAWDTDPNDATITEATTFTYTFTEKQAAIVTKAPTAKDLTYTGSAQELVTAGEATGGTMQYALGTATEATEQYTTSIPAKTDAGTYYVWYKVVGDDNHNDTAPVCVKACIAEPFGPAAFTLPAAIKTIGESAFENNTSITVVEILSGCESIGANAFKGCTGLTQIRIPLSVTSIHETAFDGCTNVLVYGTSPSTAETFCKAADNCAFVAENVLK